MKLLIICTLLFITIIEIKTKQLDEGPQTFTNSDTNAPKSSATPASSQNPQKRLATKEIIMYLTPTQIKALQSGKAYITSQQSQLETNGNQEREYLFNLRNQEEIKKDLGNLETLKPITESQNENLQLALAQSEIANSQKAVDLKPKIPEQLFYPDLEKLQPSKQLFEQQEKELTLPTSWNPFTASSFTPALNMNHQQGLLNTEWNPNPLLSQNQINLKAISLLQPLQNLDIILSPEKLIALKHAPSYSRGNNQEFEGSFDLQRKNEIAKQKALAQAEAIANSPAIVLRNYGYKKQLPVSTLEQTALPLNIQQNLKSIYPKFTKPSPAFYYFAKDSESLQ